MPCKVRPDGVIHCPMVSLDVSGEEVGRMDSLAAPLNAVFGGSWDGGKLVLAYKMLQELANSGASNELADARAKSVLGSIRMLLEEEPASVLLFNFSTLSRDSIGPWMLTKRGIPGVQDLHQKLDETMASQAP